MFAASKSGSVEAKDAQFNYVTMLLHGDGTNGAQNNTFVDSSTNAFSITRNGNTTQGTFTPYGSNWSNYFDGTGDYLTVPDNAVLDMGSSDFTIEGWVFLSSTGSSQTFVAKGTGAGNQASYHIVFNGTNWLYYLSGNGSTWSIASGVTMGAGTANTWQHLALVRSGSTFTPYVNGTAGTTTSSATALFDSTNVFSIGADDAANQRITGYISNCRVVKGTAVYTSAFTPSTTPLTAITNTQLLTCQSNRFIDNSSNAFTVTKAGDTSVQRFSPFSPTTAYSTSVIGGSGYFDGNGDYLTATQNAAFNLGTAAFTIEAWINLSTLPSGNAGIITLGNGAAGTGPQYCGWGLWVATNGTIIFERYDGTEVARQTSTAITTNQWCQIVAVRDGSSNFAIFINGVRGYSAASATTSYNNVNSDLLYVGRTISGAGPSTNYLTGYIGDVRVVAGTAVYSATSTTLTVPTAPLTAITNTSLLLNYTNAGILDNAMMNDLETVGNAQISTSVKKYGTGSLAFDGTGDYLAIPSSQSLGFGTGDMTIEGWLYLSSTSSYSTIISNRTSGGDVTTGRYSVAIRSTAFEFYANGSQIVSAGTVSTSTWTHFAVTRASNNIRLFLSGTQVGSTTAFTTDLSTLASYVGANGAGTETLTGYIDDLRITKGYARYTTTFTPSTTAFADKG